MRSELVAGLEGGGWGSRGRGSLLEVETGGAEDNSLLEVVAGAPENSLLEVVAGGPEDSLREMEARGPEDSLLGAGLAEARNFPMARGTIF